MSKKYADKQCTNEDTSQVITSSNINQLLQLFAQNKDLSATLPNYVSTIYVQLVVSGISDSGISEISDDSVVVIAFISLGRVKKRVRHSAYPT